MRVFEVVSSKFWAWTAAPPPPTAWRTSEMMSATMKMMRYQLGPMSEYCGPRTLMQNPRMV
jgi:hypothetical protein